jgi:hypothetical protein
VIIDINEMMDEELSSSIQDAGIEKVKIQSVLTCPSRRGVCAKCYGRDLATGKLVEPRQAIVVSMVPHLPKAQRWVTPRHTDPRPPQSTWLRILCLIAPCRGAP